MLPIPPYTTHAADFPTDFPLDTPIDVAAFDAVLDLIAAMNPLVSSDPDLSVDAARPYPDMLVASFDGNDGRLEFDEITLVGDFSISGRFKSTGNGYMILSGGNSSGGLELYVNGSATSLDIYISGNGYSGAPNNTLDDNLWHTFRVFRVDGLITIEVDNVLGVGGHTDSQNLTISTYGMRDGGGFVMGGQLSDVLIENDEIAAMHPLQGNLLDANGNNYPLTAHGGVSWVVDNSPELADADRVNAVGFGLSDGSDGVAIGEPVPAHATLAGVTYKGDPLTYGPGYPAALAMGGAGCRTYDGTQWSERARKVPVTGGYRTWFKSTVTGTAYIAGVHDSARGYFVLLNGNLCGGIGAQHSGIIKGTSIVNDGEWHYGELYWDGSQVTLKVDGVIEYQAPQSGSPSQNYDVAIGGRNTISGVDNWFTGLLAGFEIIDGTSAEIIALNGEGDTEFTSAGNEVTHYGNPGAGTQPHYFAEAVHGFTRYTHATLPDLRVLMVDGQRQAITPLAGYVLDDDYPTGAGVHNFGVWHYRTDLTPTNDQPPALQGLPLTIEAGDAIESPVFARRLGSYVENRVVHSEYSTNSAWTTNTTLPTIEDGWNVSTKLTTGSNASVGQGTEEISLENGTYVIDVELLAGTSDQCSLGILSQAWISLNVEVVSGAGIINVGTSLRKVTNLSAVTPTRVRLEYTVTDDNGRFYLYPDTHTSSILGASVKFRKLQIWKGTLADEIPDYIETGAEAIAIDERKGIDRILGLPAVPSAEQQITIDDYQDK